MRVERVGGELYVALTAEAVERLGLREGSAVQVEASQADAAAEPTREIRVASVDQVMASYERTKAAHAGAYRELAK